MHDENRTNTAINEWDSNSNSSFFNNLRNWALNDSLTKVMVIKYEDALKLGLVLDPDPNLLEAIVAITKTLIIAGSIISAIAFPAATGGFVGGTITAGGMAVRGGFSKIANFFAGIGSSVMQAITQR
jgi:hypothetical protein